MKTEAVTFIISGYQKDLPLENNQAAHAYLKAELDHHNIGYKTVAGKYKGFEEQSLVVVGAWTALLLDLADDVGQECILMLDANREAYLLYVDGDEQEHIGSWVTASKAEALAEDSWTYCPALDSYYVVRP